MTTKEFTLIPIEGGYVMVDKEAKIYQDDWIIRNSEITDANDEWNGETDEEWKKIIAHTGIESLKDSGLPLFSILTADDIEDVFDKEFNSMGYSASFESDFGKGFQAGYKAAGGWTDEDMIDFRAATTDQRHPLYNDYIGFLLTSPGRLPDECLAWYKWHKLKKRTPVTAVVEMEEDRLCELDGFEATFKPKVVDGYLQIKEFKYN